MSALGSSLLRLLLERAPGARISLLMGHHEAGTVQVRVDGRNRSFDIINYRMSPRAPLQEQLPWILFLSALYKLVPWKPLRSQIKHRNRWIRTVAEADLVGDIRGGDSSSDIYGLERFIRGSLPVISVLWVRGLIVLFPQTYGPYAARTARFLATYILKRASLVWSRDQESRKTVAELTSGRCNARFCPDVAFALEAVRPHDPAIEPALPTYDGRILIGINVNGLMYNGGYTRSNMFDLRLEYRAFLSQLLLALLQLQDVEILLVPHTFAAPGRVESDNDACEAVARAVPTGQARRVHRVTKAYDQFHIKGVIGMCDFFVGSRMHACIAALSQGIPTVGVAYSKKFAGVFASVGADAWVVDGREVDAEEAIQRILSLYHDRAGSRSILESRVEEANALLRREFGLLFSDA